MFNGIWLVAVEPLTIRGREVKAGEQFHLSRVHAGAYLVTGRAAIVHPQPPPKAQVAAPTPEPTPPPRRRGRPRKTVEPPSEPAPEAPAAPLAVPETPVETATEPAEAVDVPRRIYQRRDLEAEP